jgi:hypothetical protein
VTTVANTVVIGVSVAGDVSNVVLCHHFCRPDATEADIGGSMCHPDRFRVCRLEVADHVAAILRDETVDPAHAVLLQAWMEFRTSHLMILVSKELVEARLHDYVRHGYKVVSFSIVSSSVSHNSPAASSTALRARAETP